MTGLEQKIVRAVAKPRRDGQPAVEPRTFSGYLRNETGSYAVFFAVVLAVMLGGLALAAEVSSMMRLQAKLDKAASAAAIGLASDFEQWSQEFANDPASFTGQGCNPAMQEIAERYVSGNLRRGDGGLIAGSVSVSCSVPAFGSDIASNEEEVRITASASWFPVIFDKLTLAENIEGTIASGSGSARSQAISLEIAIVIDGSGAMEHTGNFNLVRDAARNFLSQLVYGYRCDDPRADCSASAPPLAPEAGFERYVSVIPVRNYVSIPREYVNWTLPRAAPDPPNAPAPRPKIPSDFSNIGATWRGCVMARKPSTGSHMNDDPPIDEDRFEAYFGPDIERFGPNQGRELDWRNIAGLEAMRYPDLGPNMYCNDNASIVPLTTDPGPLFAAIDAFDAKVGAFNMDLGVLWGWRVLSEKWQGYWGDFDPPRPFAKDTRNNVKILVVIAASTPSLLMQGVGARRVMTPYGMLWTREFNSYWYPNDPNPPTVSREQANQFVRQRTRDACQAVKNDGIEIWTISLQFSESGEMNDIMRDCATSAETYTKALTSGAIEQALVDLSNRLDTLRLVD